MCDFVIFIRYIFTSWLLCAATLHAYCQVDQSSNEKLFHKGSNKQINRTVLFSENAQKKTSFSRQLSTEDGLPAFNSFNSGVSSRTFSVTGAINVTVTVTGSTCGYYNGSIIAIASGGTSPYTYDIGDGWKYKTGNFPREAPGTYTLVVTDATGQSTSVPVTIGNTYPKVTLKAASYKRVSQCDKADASINLQASGGVPPYEYSMDGINYQSSNVFSNLYVGVYDFYVRDVNGCIGSFNAWDVGDFSNYNTCNASGLGYPTAVCGNEGEIDVTGYGPNRPYTYSIDGVNYQSLGVFKNIGPGIDTVRLKDATGALEIIVIPVHHSCYIGIDYISVDAACQQNDGTLTVTASNGTAPYTYTIDGVNYQSGNQFTGLAPGTYFITVKDANGFTNSLPATVYDRCPTVSAIVADETCVKNDGTIKATPHKGTAPYQYSIDGVNFQSSTYFTGLAAGSYTVTIRDANGFSSTADVIIKNACIQVSAQTVNTKCGGSNGSITASANNGTAPYQYSLDGVNFQTSNTFNNLKAGTYTVTAKDFSGKTGNIIVKIYDAPDPTVIANSSFASCSDNDGTVTITGTGGTLPFSYSIDGTNFQTSNNFTSLKSGTYTGFIRDGNGCISSNSVTIKIDCPAVSAVAGDETCGSKNGTITASGSSGTPPYQYAIDGSGFSSSQNFSSLSSGDYTVTIKDGAGVLNTVSVNIKNVCPIVTATATDGKCTASGGIINAGGSNGYSPYQYSIDGVNFQQSNVFSSLSSGDYTVTIKDSRGLTSTTTATIHNFPSPQLIVTTTDATCLNNDGEILLANNGGTSPFTYSIDGINFQGVGMFDKLNTGNYAATIKDANGCTANEVAIVSLNDNLILNVGNQKELCEGDSTQLMISSNATSFNWSPQKNINTPGIQNPTVSPSQTTMYVVETSWGICSKKDSVLVKVNPAPVASAQKDTVICFGQSVGLFGSGGLKYSWSPSTYLNDPSSPRPVVTSPKSSVVYTLKVTDQKGCSSLNIASVKVDVTPPAKLFAGNDTSVVMNQPFQLNAQDVNNSGFVSYSWSPSDGLNNSDIQNPIAVLDHSVVYKVIAMTQAGCEGTDEISIKVFRGPDIYVPNAFTPNGDGVNDILRPLPIGIKEFKYFAVYNRYGEKVFYTSKQNNGWNGTVNEQFQKTDVFVWLAEGIDDKGNVIKRKGTVILVK